MKLRIGIASGVSLGVLIIAACQHYGGAKTEAATGDQPIPDKVSYNWDVRPILSQNCFRCHGHDPANRKAGLRLDEAAAAYGDLPEDRGKHAIVRGNPSKSELYRRISSTDGDYRMPPKDTHLRLSAHDVAVLQKWIKQGAAYEPHWAYITPKEVRPVSTQWDKQGVNPIDRYVYAGLAKASMHPSPEADRETLINRVTLDLTGLPPTLAQVDAFVADKDPNAYEHLVDRLLASRQYAERQTNIWMDVARYADSDGFLNDGFGRFQYPYRDWVISAFQRDIPYDKFVTWQIAGDLLPNATREQVLATAFTRSGKKSNEAGIIDEEYRVEYVNERAEMVGKAFLGLTVGCAKCHDHKYDVIAQADYYSLGGFFNSVDERGIASGNAWGPTLAWPTDAQAKRLQTARQTVAQKEAALQAVITAARPLATATVEAQLKSGPQAVPGLIQTDLDQAQQAYYPMERVYKASLEPLWIANNPSRGGGFGGRGGGGRGGPPGLQKALNGGRPGGGFGGRFQRAGGPGEPGKGFKRVGFAPGGAPAVGSADGAATDSGDRHHHRPTDANGGSAPAVDHAGPDDHRRGAQVADASSGAIDPRHLQATDGADSAAPEGDEHHRRRPADADGGLTASVVDLGAGTGEHHRRHEVTNGDATGAGDAAGSKRAMGRGGPGGGSFALASRGGRGFGPPGPGGRTGGGRGGAGAAGGDGGALAAPEGPRTVQADLRAATAKVQAEGKFVPGATALPPTQKLLVGLDEKRVFFTPDAKNPKLAGAINNVHFIDGPPGKGKAILIDDTIAFANKDVGQFERTQPFSLDIWIKLRADKAYPEVNVLYNEDRGGAGYHLALEDNVLKFGLENTAPYNMIEVAMTKPLDKGQWTHVTATYDGSSTASGAHLYINGQPVQTEILHDRLDRSIVPRGGSSTFGSYTGLSWGRQFGLQEFNKGGVDELRVFTRALTPVEVAYLHDRRSLVGAAPAAVRDQLIQVALARDPKVVAAAAELKAAREAAQAANSAIPTLNVLGDRMKVRPTYLLDRGNYDQHVREVPVQALPQVFPWKASYPRNRVGLARWLFDPKNPLTARVYVNRLWQSHFGTGIVETVEDFGTQGSNPTNPQLLDYLAVEFVRSGWDVKHMQKLMVMSATYRQSSGVSRENLEKDPRDFLLERGPRYRLPAEVIRDNALAASGLLIDQPGGDSVFPYQPEGVWDDTGVGTQAYPDETLVPADEMHRRSLYTFIKRNAQFPSMAVFDLADRNVSTVARKISNTPLQALVLLNDPQFVEAYRKLAERAMQASANPDDQVIMLFRLATRRHPMASEMGHLRAYRDQQIAHMKATPDDVNALLKVGVTPSDPKAHPQELAAMTMVAAAIMNSPDAYSLR